MKGVPKITAIFPHDVKPVHHGVYGTRLMIGVAEGAWRYSYWDGADWHESAVTPDEAMTTIRNNARWLCPQDKQWYGLRR
jgi:hypothetical protein